MFSKGPQRFEKRLNKTVGDGIFKVRDKGALTPTEGNYPDGNAT
jgi:hypothetical protein